MNCLKTLSVSIIILFSLNVFAQNGEPISIPRINGEIIFDGLSDEDAWQNIETLPLTMFQPTFKGQPSNNSEILVAYDDEYFYLAGRFYYNDPSKVSMNTFKRDGFSNSDCFNIIIDTYNDNENAMYFMTTPSGLRRDCLLSDDGNGWNLDWNTYWDTKSIVNEQGWFAEVRIPFSSLRFQKNNGEITMGLLVHRYTIKLMERVTFPAVSPSITNEPFKPSMAYDIKLRDVSSKKPVYITPYILSGADRSYSLNTAQNAYTASTVDEFEGGLDIKYNLTSNLTLDLTANTDFAQVEADDEQVNLNRFSLFFPEKRQFFQERSNIFDFGTGGYSRLFHSRRIGLTDEGKNVRIFGGARLVGRIGEWDMGFLDMHTDNTENTPKENFGVLRLRRRVINPYSYVGGMLTNRAGENGSYNTALGLDGTIRLKGNDYFIYNYAATFEKGGKKSLADNSRIRLRLVRRQIRGLFYTTELIKSGKGYNPGMGFIMRNNFFSGNQTVGYGWTPNKSSRLRNYRVTFNSYGVYSNQYKAAETFEAYGQFTAEYKSGIYLYVRANYSYENVFEKFNLENGENEVYVPEGIHRFGKLDFFFSLGEGQNLVPSVRMTAGNYFDGKIYSFSPGIGWYLSKYINFTTNYSLNRIKFDSRNQSFISHLAGLRAELTLNTRFSLNSFLQYNSISDKFISNIRFRYNFSEGNDLYIVYNDILNTERDLSVPRLPYSDSKALVMKFTRTFMK
ncbi:DUF5916 domain-containing protein [candidate division KSB1 bacterium]